MKKALVILSGGQDSTYCLFWAKKNYDEVHAITFNYGQRHRVEVLAAMRVADLAGVASHRTIRIGDDVFAGSSPLTTNAPLEQYETVEEMKKKVGDSVEKTFVPGRNIVFLAIAASHASAMGIEDVVIGVSEEDFANYPDCRGDFLMAMELALRQGLQAGIQVRAPLIFMSKADSVRRAADDPLLWDALAYTHTAYDGAYPPTSHDHASMLRARAFLEARLPDPLVLRAHREGLMALPDTPNYDSARA